MTYQVALFSMTLTDLHGYFPYCIVYKMQFLVNYAVITGVKNNFTSTSVFGDGRISTQLILRVASALDKSTSVRASRAGRRPISPILGFRGSFRAAKFPKMGDSLPRTPMNRRAKFDAAIFNLDGETRNRTMKRTKLQTVSDISTHN